MNHVYEQYERLRTGRPLLHQGGAIYVLGYDEAKQILGDHKRFVKDIRSTLPPQERPSPEAAASDMFTLLYGNMLSADGAGHRRLRALVSRAFTVRNVQSLAPRIQAIASQLVDQFIAQGQADLIAAFAFPTPSHAPFHEPSNHPPPVMLNGACGAKACPERSERNLST